MAAIHRLLCTHCTFGSSELEPSTAENGSKVLGYSVRRSSLPEPDRGPLRAAFRGVERLLSYDLPKDTPPARKESLDAETSPRRLIFMPNLAGWQAAAHVSYRTRDTHGRIGSYFADVLAARLDRDTRPWCPLEVLKLWAASHDGSLQGDCWCDSEESLSQRDGDGPWKPADATAPAELRGFGDALLDDRLLYQFLTLEPGEAADDPGTIVPPRWWSMPACQRRDLLAGLLNAVIQSRKSGGRDSVIVASEPSAAAVLFYGVFRLLPPKLHEGIGFSTYEAAPERSLTQLVATTFIDGETSAADLPAELAAHGFACNTFRDVAKFGRSQPIPADGFVHRVITLASSVGDWERLDGFLTAIDALPRPDFRSLDEIARIDAFVTRYVTGSDKPDSLGSEPPASPGSVGERFRRMRFRELVVNVGARQGGKMPRDLVRTAIGWLGDDFVEVWNSGGPLGDTLRTRLPDGNNGLAKVLDALKAVRVVPADFVRDAVVGVALATNPSELPPAFVQFITPARGDRRGSSGGRSDANAVVQAVIEGLTDNNRLDLIEAADAACVEPILDAVVAWEKSEPGGWQQLGLRLEPLVERKLDESNSTINDQVEFLVRYDGLARVLGQSGGVPTLSQKLDGLFSELLRFTTALPKPLHPGQLLTADGNSRAESLSRWLYLTPPTNADRYRNRLAAWKTIHDIIIRLREPAEKAGRFAKCPIDLAGFDKACEVLSRDNPGPGSTAAQRMQFLLAKSMDGLKVAEPAKQTIARWLVAALPDDWDHTERIGFTSSKSVAGGRARSGRGQSRLNRNWLYAGIFGAVAVAASVFAGVALWQRQSPPQTDIAKKEGAVAGSQSSEGRQERGIVENSSGSRGPAAPAGPQPSPTDFQSQPLTAESLKFDAELKAGKIEVRWNKDVPHGTKLTLHITAPSDTPAHAIEIKEKSDVAAGRKTISFPKSDEFGEYAIRITAEHPGKPSIESSKTIPVPRPPVPTVGGVMVDVDEQGKPQLHISITPPDLTQHGKCKAILTMSGNSFIREESLLESLTFGLPADNPELTPSKLLATQSLLKLHYDTDLGVGEAFGITIPPPEGGDLETEVQRRLAQKQSQGVMHVCALEEAFHPGKQTSLLDLPWWFVDAERKEFSLDLLPSGKKTSTDVPDPKAIRLSATTDNPKKWECKSGEAVVGFFELVNKNPWKPALCFTVAGKPGEVTSEDARQAYARLRTFKLCFLNRDKPFATAQLMNPNSFGPLVVRLPKDKSKNELPAISAATTLPVEWWQLNGISCCQGLPNTLSPPVTFHLTNNAFRASNENAEVTAQVFFLATNNGKVARLGMKDWKWSKVPPPAVAEEKQSNRKDVTAFERRAVSPKLLVPVGEREDSLGTSERTLAEKERDLKNASKDTKDAAEMARDVAASDVRSIKEEMNEHDDDRFLPCFRLFESLVDAEKSPTISNWQLMWSTLPTTTRGITVPDGISGGLTVVGVSSVPDSEPPVELRPNAP
jgi:hypothetical protein